MQAASILAFFHIDALALILIALVGFISLVVASFARRYLQGDRMYGRFFLVLSALTGSVMVLVSADHLLLFLAAWGLSNALLVVLMVHKASWTAARASGVLAGKTFALGWAAIAAAFGLLYSVTGQTSIQAILTSDISPSILIAALLLLLLGAMTQSSIWPFHRWLISSLNSPTPVSAFMHAGLVNGGGFLLARFAPLYVDVSALLAFVFVVGLATAMIGTLWKLMQHDVKRMLACSTMAQMGFMVAQCGLGLFPAAVAHLCWHGLFKANLFLASGAAAQEKRLHLSYPPSAVSFGLALLCGIAGAVAFAVASGKPLGVTDTTFVLVVVAGIAATQFALTLLGTATLLSSLIAFVGTTALGSAYGLSVWVFELALSPLGLLNPQPLNVVHLAGLAVLISAWLAMLFVRIPDRIGALPAWAIRLYVKSLNASQPHPATVTPHRNAYDFA